MDKCVNCVGVSAFPESNWKAVTVMCCVYVFVHVQVDESDSCIQSLAHGVPPAALQCKLCHAVSNWMGLLAGGYWCSLADTAKFRQGSWDESWASCFPQVITSQVRRERMEKEETQRVSMSSSGKTNQISCWGTEKPDKLIVVDEVTVFYYQTSLLKLKQLCQDVVFFHFSMFVTCCQFWATAETGWYCLQEGRPTEHDLSN